MKKPLLFIMALLSISIATAQDFIVNNIAYNIIPGTTTVEVTKKAGCYNGVVTIPATVTYNSATYTVTSIGELAFVECSSLSTISIPDSVTSIQKAAFVGCNGLTALDLPDSLTSIGIAAFSECENLTSIDIPNSVTSIGFAAFQYCINLSSVTLGKSVSSIERFTFKGCRVLNSIVIPDSVTSIGDEAFSECLKMTKVSIGNSVTSIGNSAFYRCRGLKSVTVKKPIPIFISDNVFYPLDLSLITLYVPRGSESAYEAARFWQDFNPIIGINLLDKTLNEGDIIVYPVPAKNTLHIKQNTSAKLEQATLLNLNGEIVKTGKENTMNVSSLDQGIYTLRLRTNQGIISKKVVKN